MKINLLEKFREIMGTGEKRRLTDIAEAIVETLNDYFYETDAKIEALENRVKTLEGGTDGRSK